MNDLISRSKLKEALMECLDDDKIQEALNFFGIYDFIDDAPTAYNVEKVVQQLENKIKELTELKLSNEQKAQNYGYAVAINHAIEIVRNGRKE